jgi:hypothetical protein
MAGIPQQGVPMLRSKLIALIGAGALALGAIPLASHASIRKHIASTKTVTKTPVRMAAKASQSLHLTTPKRKVLHSTRHSTRHLKHGSSRHVQLKSTGRKPISMSRRTSTEYRRM